MRKKIFTILFFSFMSFGFCAEIENSLELFSESAKLGFSIFYDPLSETGILEKNSKQISFKIGNQFLLDDCQKIVFTDAPKFCEDEKIGKKNILVSNKFLLDLQSLFKNNSDSGGLKIGAILIDPGHGGKDPGALFTHTINGKKTTIVEKDINLKVSKMLFSQLKSAYPEKKIIMTRDSDKYLALSERTEIANSVKLGENEAIIYISIHVNSSLDKKASGYEVWYLSPGFRRTVIDEKGTEKNLFNILNSMMEEEYTTESILIAKFLMDGMKAQIGTKSTARGIKAEEWFVVKKSNMPAVLVELGFLTNYKEACLLNDQNYLQKLSLGIFNGLSAFVTHFERSRGFTVLQ